MFRWDCWDGALTKEIITWLCWQNNHTNCLKINTQHDRWMTTPLIKLAGNSNIMNFLNSEHKDKLWCTSNRDNNIQQFRNSQRSLGFRNPQGILEDCQCSNLSKHDQNWLPKLWSTIRTKSDSYCNVLLTATEFRTHEGVKPELRTHKGVL